MALELRRAGLVSEIKADGSIVTNGDKIVSEYVVRELMKAFPDDGIVSEERADISGLLAVRRWVIDPIDGTKHYAKDGTLFSVMVSLVDEKPVFSMVYYPVLRRWYWAERGKGAYMEQRAKIVRLHVQPPHHPPRIVHGGECLYAVGEEGTKGIMKYYSKIVHGKLDCFVRSDVPYWDLCPPMLLLTEAGGVAVDFDGKELHYRHDAPFSPQVVAGHPVAVAEALLRIQQIRRQVTQ